MDTTSERRELIELDNPQISKSRQCKLLGISRSILYYERKGISERDLVLMKAVDEQYMKTPYYGRRRMCKALKKQGYHVSEKKVRRLMQHMGLKAIAPGPNTSKKSSEHKVYPYLLRDIEVTRPNQVWCTDITYVPMQGGFMYLCVIMDWYSRRILTWSLEMVHFFDGCYYPIFCMGCWR